MKFKKFKSLKSIERKRNPLKSRLKKIRLEKNERISNYNLDFLKKIKLNLKSEHISAYPEVEELYKLLAKRLSISSDMIVFTAGSDLAIKNCFELLISPGDEVITLNPTYGMVDVYSRLFQAKQIKINYNKNLVLDKHKLFKSINKKTNLVILANPNSPTGTTIDEKSILKIIKLCKKYNSYVLIDECYFGYYSKSMIKYTRNFNNLIISRSFSKIGLAGCRIGYLVASKKTSKMLYKFRPFYEITSFSCLVLKQILNNVKIFQEYIKATLDGKIFLMKNLKRLNYQFFSTNTNFILIKLKSEFIKNRLIKIFAKENILVLGESKLPDGHKILRITLGPKKYMKKVVNQLRKIPTNAV